jgi:hypothetical protein
MLLIIGIIIPPPTPPLRRVKAAYLRAPLQGIGTTPEPHDLLRFYAGEGESSDVTASSTKPGPDHVLKAQQLAHQAGIVRPQLPPAALIRVLYHEGADI